MKNALQNINESMFTNTLSKNEMSKLVGGLMPAAPLRTAGGEGGCDVDGICCNYSYDLAYANGTVLYCDPVPNGKDC